MLEEKLMPAIHSCHRGLLPKGVLLSQGNEQPYAAAAATVTTIQKLKTVNINHPPYSTDLAPSDYHVFGMPEEALRG
jgi:hypothetical protein